MLQTSSCLAKHWNSVSYLHVGPNNTKLQIMILLKHANSSKVLVKRILLTKMEHHN